jgi:hypothetical protein
MTSTDTPSRARPTVTSRSKSSPEAAEAAEGSQDTTVGVDTQTHPDLRTATLRLPFAALSVSVPRRITDEAARAGQVVTANAPSPDRLAFYAGLGLLAALEVLEWPVAATVAAGTYVASRGQREPTPEWTESRARAKSPAPA